MTWSRRFPLLAGGTGVALVVLVAVLSWVWTPFDPSGIDPTHRLLGPGSGGHWLGTDTFGTDVASKVMAGARTCLLVGIVSVAIAALTGVPLGVLSGMARGRLGRAIVRVTDMLYAFPAILLAILLAAALGGSTLTGMLAIGTATIPVFTRIARAATLVVVHQDYVAAARASGIPWRTVARTHVWPNIAPLMGVQASVSFAMAILSEAALSYLGLATPPTTPTWGRMLYDARMQMFNAPLLSLWPALAIILAVTSFNLLGDGLRDLLDPRLREVA